MNLDHAHSVWRKSTASGDNNACVEVALGATVGVRDTKDRTAGHLTLPTTAWEAFVMDLKANER